MIKIIAYTLLLLPLSWTVSGQLSVSKQIKATGKVVYKSSGLPLEYATVSFFRKDGKLVSGGITNEQGHFSINSLLTLIP